MEVVQRLHRRYDSLPTFRAISSLRIRVILIENVNFKMPIRKALIF